MDFNEIVDPNFIFVGMELGIPKHSSQLIRHREPLSAAQIAIVKADPGLNVREAPTVASAVQYVARLESKLKLSGVRRIESNIEWLELADGNWVQSRYLHVISQVTVIATNGLNVRSSPSMQGRVLRILPFETQIELTGHSRQSEGLSWAELRSGGWVQERYLEFS